MLSPQYQGPYAPLPPNIRPPTAPLNNPQTYVELTNDQKVGVSGLVSHKEKIYYAGAVPKVNKHQTAQNRIIVISNKNFYNIDPERSFFSSLCLCSSSSGYTTKRRIDINKIFGVTVSTNPTSELQQFVIHVKGEYDYLFNGGQKRERILKSLLNAHFANSSEPFVLFCRDEANLTKFHTTDDDFAAKVNKRPKDGQILVTPDMAANGIEWVIFNRKNFKNKPAVPNNNSRPSYPNQWQPMAPGYPGPNNFPGSQPGYFPPQNVPQWGNPYPAGPMSHIPSYYVPEAQPQQPIFPSVPTGMNAPYQYQNPAPVQNIEFNANTTRLPTDSPNRLVKQAPNDYMTMQAKKQSSTPTDQSFIQKNILPYNANPNANVQIQTNFDYAPLGQQQNMPYNNNYNYNNGYNNVQNQNARGPAPY